MKFRRATPDDTESILRLWKESGATRSITDDADTVRRVAEHPYAVFLLASQHDEIVGSIIGTFDGWRGNFYRLVVRPHLRRQGIGRELVRRVEAIFAEWGVRRTNALTEVDRPVARAFWSSVGYAADEHVRRHVRSDDSA